MATTQQAPDPYESLLSLEDALLSLQILRHVFRNKDVEAEDLLDDLTFRPWWRAPLAHLKSYFLKIDVTLPVNGGNPIALSLRSAVRAYEDAKKHLLTHEFKMGNYPIFGYAVPRTPQATREPIPVNIWADGVEIDWERSTVRNGSLMFEGVRVQDIDVPTEDNADTSTAPKRGPGRPSLSKRMEEVYEDTRDKGLFLSCSTKKAIYALVRERIKTSYPDEIDAINPNKGLGYDAIANAIGKSIDQDKRDGRLVSDKL